MTISFRTKLLASHVAVALVVGAVTLVMVDRSVSQRMETQVDQRLEAQARAVASWSERTGHPDRLAGRLAGVVGARVTLFNELGQAVGDSHSTLLQSHPADESTAVEVQAARNNSVGRVTRYSRADGERVRYVAVPGSSDSVVRLGVSMGEVEELKSEVRRQLSTGALLFLLLAIALATLVAWPLTRGLREATTIARRIGAGDYSVSNTSTHSRDEIGVLSQTLASAAGELRATEERRRAFLATVAHEIRTPVTSIRGYAQTLAASQVNAKDREEFAETIHRNAVRVSQLVEDLLELEAIQARASDSLDRQSVALAPVIDHVVKTLKTQIDARGATVEVECADDIATLGDADALERILLNLVDNALRHGGPKVAVRVTARTHQGHTTVQVRDNGRGIPSNQRELVFERFHRGIAATDPERSGSGLGLAIARELAMAMGGSLTLVDREGPGAQFELRLTQAA